jgi:hypothetical protein
MSLGTRAGHVLRIAADGADAAVAVERILALVRDGFGELASAEKTGRREPAIDGFGQRRIGVSPGRVVGRAVRLPDLTYRRISHRASVAAPGRTVVTILSLMFAQPPRWWQVITADPG